MQRVVAPHEALQLGKLAHHAGEQVGFRQPRRALGEQRVGFQGARDAAGQELDALDALELRAELVVVDDAGELRHARFEPELAVLVVEEASILEPRPHHALVAADDRARVGELHVGNDEELRHELSRRVEQREIFLVLPHGEDQAFLRHLEVRRVESPHVNARQLHQRGDFVEQLGVLAQRAAFALRGCEQLALDLIAPPGEIRDHGAVFQQALLVFFGVAQCDLGCAHEAMATRDIARFQPEHAALNHAAPVQHDQAMHRPHELRLARAPAHHFRNRQVFQRLLDDLGKRCVERRALEHDSCEEKISLGRLAPLQLPDRNTVLLGEARNSLRRRLGRGTDDFGVAVLAFIQHISDLRCQAPGGGKESSLGRRHEAPFSQTLENAFGEGAAKPTERLRRQLFRQQLDQ